MKLVQTLTARMRAYDFGTDVIARLIRSARVHAYDFRDPVAQTPRYWRDIGTLESYYESNMDLLCTDSPFNSVHAAGKSIVSPDVEIESGARVERSVVMRGIRIGRGARIRKAIIDENVYIPAGTAIGCDSEEDRKKYFVTDTGITVVRGTNVTCHSRVVEFPVSAPVSRDLARA